MRLLCTTPNPLPRNCIPAVDKSGKTRKNGSIKFLLPVATMSFNDLEKKRIENALDKFLAKRRPPPHIRKELDIGYRLSGQSIELLEIRPQWDDPSVIHQRPLSKATFVRAQDCWKVFWINGYGQPASSRLAASQATP